MPLYDPNPNPTPPNLTDEPSTDAPEGNLRHRVHIPRGGEGQGENPGADFGRAHR